MSGGGGRGGGGGPGYTLRKREGDRREKAEKAEVFFGVVGLVRSVAQHSKDGLSGYLHALRLTITLDSHPTYLSVLEFLSLDLSSLGFPFTVLL